jgi:hypothetical protein
MKLGKVDRRMLEARLLVSSPEVVFEELKIYGSQIKDDHAYASDDELEASLAGRNEALIDLGLARYGANTEIVRALYKKGLVPPVTPLDGRYRKGLRMACLANESVPTVHYVARTLDEFPALIVGSEEVRRVLSEADWDEAEALICNACVCDSLLRALYERREPFSEFDEERWRNLIVMSGKNSRFATRDESVGVIWAAIFKLLETAPTTETWLMSLYYLLDSLNPLYRAARPEKIDHVLKRWESVTIKDYKGNPERGLFTSAERGEEFRCMIAALYGEAFVEGKFVALGSLGSPDMALRCAYYGNAKLTAKEMAEGNNRDRDVFVFAALFNEHVYRTPALRKLLEEEYLIGDPESVYRKRCEQLHDRYRNFDPRPSAELRRLGELAGTTDTKLAALSKQLMTVKNWLILGFAIVGVLVLRLGR